MAMMKLRCVVEHITYQNQENGYSVMRVKVKDYADLVTLVGNLLDVPVGAVLLCDGVWKMDKRYGRQFVCETWEEVMPATVYGIEKYLGSGLVKGIGPKFAHLIVERFGTETIDIIEEDIERLAEEIVKLVKHRLPKAYNQPLSNIQVLTPMQRSVVGAGNLNMLLQQALNTSTLGISRGGINYKLGDRVMQIRNNYDKNVFNGDIGIIEKVNMEDRTLCIRFDGSLVEYEASELDEVTLAYATTIHKSQGSEYPIVVIPVLMTHFVMLQRNLIYTGITRAKKICVLIGQPKALAYAIRNLTVNKRNTKLKERLRGELQDSHMGLPYQTVEDEPVAMAAEPAM